jgi:CHAT domain-containing protein/tetratricopeptide (TPR) repeat protein
MHIDRCHRTWGSVQRRGPAGQSPSTLARVCCALALFQTICGAPKPSSDADRFDEIAPGKSLRAQIADKGQTYRLRLEAGQSARLLIDQHDTDLILSVAAPNEREPRTVDARDRFVESATILADATGDFRIDVRPFGPAKKRNATYELRLESAPHTTTPQERLRRQAELLATDGKRLQENPAAEAQRTALEQFRASLALWRQIGDSDGEAAALNWIGYLLHTRAEFEEAEAEYLKALALSRRPGGDRRRVGELLNNIGAGYWQRGALRDAKRHFEQALAESRASKLRSTEAATLTNMGMLFFESGDYQQALDRFGLALEIFQSENETEGEAKALHNIGVTYRALGDLDAALSYVSRSLSRFSAVGESVSWNNNPVETARAEGRAKIRLGEIHLARGDAKMAQVTAETALTEIIRPSGDRVGEVDALDLLGQIASVSGDAEGALAYYEEAVTRSRSSGSRLREATALHHSGAVLVSLGRQARARDALERALAIRHEAVLRDPEAETLFQIALAEWQAGNLPQAQSRLGAALTLTEEVRGLVAGEYSRTTYFAARQTYFATYIDLLMQRHARDPAGGFDVAAFETSERERARSLLDGLEESRADIRSGVDPALLAQEREQQQELNLWSYRLAAVVDRAGAEREAAQVRERINEVLAAYRETQARIRAVSPRYALLAGPAPLSVAEVQRDVLDSETILLRFTLSEPHSYVWLLTPRSLKVASLPGRGQIDRAARRVYELVSAKRLPSNAAGLQAQYRRAATELSAMLLAPVAAELKARRLLIVSDGALQFVPFAALPEPGGRSPLVSRYEIVMLPSASTLAVLRRQVAARSPAAKLLAVVADPVYEPTDPRVVVRPTSSSRDPRGAPPMRLPFSRFEGESILRLVPPSQRYEAFGFAASRVTATSPVLRDYRIVHFAAHAISDNVHPELSGIVLSLIDRNGATQDGLLRLLDIYEASLPADLVVLSACQTAIGKDVPGEGVMGLARGFIAAGAARVVASQYKVDDEATGELMRAFYEEMLGPNPLAPAAALRAAQMKLAAQPRWRDPHWWSAFVITGEPR